MRRDSHCDCSHRDCSAGAESGGGLMSPLSAERRHGRADGDSFDGLVGHTKVLFSADGSQDSGCLGDHDVSRLALRCRAN